MLKVESALLGDSNQTNTTRKIKAPLTHSLFAAPAAAVVAAPVMMSIMEYFTIFQGIMGLQI